MPVRKQERKNTNKAVAFIFINNNKGLHTRPGTELVKCATGFNSKINLYYKNFIVNAKSLLGILMLAAEKGSKIMVEAIGDDAQKAVSAIASLAENKFNIQY
jgi:phosphocarrier protein